MRSEAGIAIVTGSSNRRRFLKSVLDGTHHRILEAFNRTHALRLLERHRISVIISDCQLPDGDWKDLLSATACVPEAPRLIVVATSDPGELWAEVLNLGGFDVLTQPLDAEEVGRTVEVAAEAWTRQNEPVLHRSAVLIH